MSAPKPVPLRENASLAFLGETVWAVAKLTPRQAKSIEADRNPTGRPNADVLRQLVGVRVGQIETQVQIDFPAHFTGQEASLYQKPFQFLQKKAPVQSEPNWWLNPHANTDLRNAIARIERYLATPKDTDSPAWDWIESDRLPMESLLIVARDDDFTHGLLQSQLFSVWWQTSVREISPTEVVQSFPFPWPPTTLLSALSREQEDHRLAVARAVRAGDQERLNSAVAAAYGISNDKSDAEIVRQVEAFARHPTKGRQGNGPTQM